MVIPAELRSSILAQLHVGHSGMSAMKEKHEIGYGGQN